MRNTLILARVYLMAQARKQTHLATLFAAVILFMMPAYVNSYSVGRLALERIAKDMGLTLISYFGIGMALVLGSTGLREDLVKKTAYGWLARPVSRAGYIGAHFLALGGVLAVSLVLLGLVLTVSVGLLGDYYDPRVSLAVLGYTAEATLILAATLALSTQFESAPAAVGGLTLYLVGGLSSAFLQLVSPTTRPLLKAGQMLVPNLQFFRLKPFVVDSLVLGTDYLAALFLYWMVWLVLFLMLANSWLKGRDL